MTAINALEVCRFTFGRRKLCEPHRAKMRDENASHRMDRLRRPVALGLLWSAAATSKLVPMPSAEISSASMR